MKRTMILQIAIGLTIAIGFAIGVLVSKSALEEAKSDPDLTGWSVTVEWVDGNFGPTCLTVVEEGGLMKGYHITQPEEAVTFTVMGEQMSTICFMKDGARWVRFSEKDGSVLEFKSGLSVSLK
jgi:hypothetical protein